jgi:hypothetical protein
MSHDDLSKNQGTVLADRLTFAAGGDVLRGPAVKRLPPVNIPR